MMVIRFENGKRNVLKRSICGNVDQYNAVIAAQEKQKQLLQKKMTVRKKPSSR